MTRVRSVFRSITLTMTYTPPKGDAVVRRGRFIAWSDEGAKARAHHRRYDFARSLGVPLDAVHVDLELVPGRPTL